jgi:hypothetical protein
MLNAGNSGFRVKIKKYPFFDFSRNDSFFDVPVSENVPVFKPKNRFFLNFRSAAVALSFLRKQESAVPVSVKPKEGGCIWHSGAANILLKTL